MQPSAKIPMSAAAGQGRTGMPRAPVGSCAENKHFDMLVKHAQRDRPFPGNRGSIQAHESSCDRALHTPILWGVYP